MLDKLKQRMMPSAGSGPHAPFSPPENAEKLVRRRRIQRRLKAAFSIGLAVAAGTFVACQRMLGASDKQKQGNNPPTTPPTTQSQQHTTTNEDKDVSDPPKDLDVVEQPAEDQDIVIDTTAEPDTASQDTSQKNKDVKDTKDGKIVKKKKKKKNVDIYEFQNGMPVRDNLLE